MLRVALALSLVFNIVLGVFFYFNNSTIQFNQQEITRVKGIYAKDIKLLKYLIEGRLKKTELQNIFKSNLDEHEYFDKPSDNGVGAGFLFFVFDHNETLERVVEYDFAKKTL